MERRKFLKLSIVGSAASVMVPACNNADVPGYSKSQLAGSVFYTAESPGRWSGKEGGHVPTIEVSGSKVQITTAHEMNEYEHYIVKHILLDQDLGFVHETMFNPETDSPISEYDLGSLQTRIYALSICNKHDAWLNVLEL